MSAAAPLLILIGPPGAGKTEVGKCTAELLRVPFVDTDRRIVESVGDIPAIFAERGEEGFRAVERVEVAKALSESGVVALGGGAILNDRTQSDLAAHRVAYLTVSRGAVKRRIRGDSRPLVKDGIDAWVALVDSRRDVYERLADRTVDSSHRSVQSIAHELAQWVRQEEQI